MAKHNAKQNAKHNAKQNALSITPQQNTQHNASRSTLVLHQQKNVSRQQHNGFQANITKVLRHKCLRFFRTANSNPGILFSSQNKQGKNRFRESFRIFPKHKRRNSKKHGMQLNKSQVLIFSKGAEFEIKEMVIISKGL